MEQSEWREIESFPNYLISSSGEVYNLKFDRYIQAYDKQGYLYVNLSNNGEVKTLRINRLVANAFISNPMNKPQVNHVDGNKYNNNYQNLEWVTSSENLKHAFSTGLKTVVNKRGVRIVETREEFDSLEACADYVNGYASNIRHCLSGRIKSHKGYTYEYL